MTNYQEQSINDHLMETPAKLSKLCSRLLGLLTLSSQSCILRVSMTLPGKGQSKHAPIRPDSTWNPVVPLFFTYVKHKSVMSEVKKEVCVWGGLFLGSALRRSWFYHSTELYIICIQHNSVLKRESVCVWGDYTMVPPFMKVGRGHAVARSFTSMLVSEAFRWM